MASLLSRLRGGPSSGSSSSKTSSGAPSPGSPKSRTWPLNGHAAGASEAAGSSAAQQAELSDIEDAMEAAALIMNDDVEGAEVRLKQRCKDSSFHQLGMGVAIFMRSILGFEKEIMLEAASRLSDTESRAWSDMKKAQKEADKAAGGGGGYWSSSRSGAGGAGGSSGHIGGRVSNIYPPGTEFALVHAEAQLMNAIVSVMQESLTEGVKGFYKLRKAFLTLNGIMESELQYLRTLEGGGAANGGSSTRAASAKDEIMLGSFDEEVFADLGDGEKKAGAGAEKHSPSGSEDDFLDAAAELSGAQTPASGNAMGQNGSAKSDTDTVDRNLGQLKLQDDKNEEATLRDPDEASSGPHEPIQGFSVLDQLSNFGTDSKLFTSTVDVFVHSGANMCFGMLLLLISMVPPAFSRLLYIIGFKGDRERGVAMLWQSTKFPNVNGAVAGLSLLGYYNGLLGFADILPTERDVAELTSADNSNEIVGYPKERCRALLADMRARYPDSPLWKLEEARVLANSKRLPEAVAMLRANTSSRMRQVTALNNFELALDAMFLMDWPLMRDGFLKSVELNDWSHAIYYYMAGAAELELYRDAFHQPEDKKDDSSSERAARHKKRAEELFRKTPMVAGRKRFMARQMPLEVFVCRKLAKWEERAKVLGVDLADAIGASPAMEMAYTWNGTKRLTPDLADKALAHLAWGRCTLAADKLEKIREEKDEVAVRAVAEAAVWRVLGKTDAAREAVKEVLEIERTAFKGPTRDDYALPAAHYEIAAAAWMEASSPELWPADADEAAVDRFRQAKVEECREALDRVAKWETFVLDARVGMRVQAGLDTIRWLKGKKGWP